MLSKLAIVINLRSSHKVRVATDPSYGTVNRLVDGYEFANCHILSDDDSTARGVASGVLTSGTYHSAVEDFRAVADLQRPLKRDVVADPYIVTNFDIPVNTHPSAYFYALTQPDPVWLPAERCNAPIAQITLRPYAAVGSNLHAIPDESESRDFNVGVDQCAGMDLCRWVRALRDLFLRHIRPPV